MCFSACATCSKDRAKGTGKPTRQAEENKTKQKHLRIFFSLFARKRKGAPAKDGVSNSDHPHLSFLKPVCTMLVLPTSCRLRIQALQETTAKCRHRKANPKATTFNTVDGNMLQSCRHANISYIYFIFISEKMHFFFQVSQKKPASKAKAAGTTKKRAPCHGCDGKVCIFGKGGLPAQTKKAPLLVFSAMQKGSTPQCSTARRRWQSVFQS